MVRLVGVGICRTVKCVVQLLFLARWIGVIRDIEPLENACLIAGELTPASLKGGERIKHRWVFKLGANILIDRLEIRSQKFFACIDRCHQLLIVFRDDPVPGIKVLYKTVVNEAIKLAAKRAAGILKENLWKIAVFCSFRLLTLDRLSYQWCWWSLRFLQIRALNLPRRKVTMSTHMIRKRRLHQLWALRISIRIVCRSPPRGESPQIERQQTQ